MSIHISVYCRSGEVVTGREIGELVVDGVFFDEDPQIDPAVDSPEASSPSWEQIAIRYAKRKRPVLVSRVEGEALAEDVRELLDEHPEVWRRHPEIAERLRASRHGFDVEVGAGVPDECWHMVDVIESFLAKKLDGLVVSSDAVFDADLKSLCDLSDG